MLFKNELEPSVVHWQLDLKRRETSSDVVTRLVEDLMLACVHGLATDVRMLLANARAAKVDIISGNTCLHSAAIHGHLDVLTILLDNQVDANQTDSDGVTALHWACYTGSAEMASKLLSHGASVSCRDSNQCEPLFLAAQHGHLKLVRMLLHAKASVHTVNRVGRTALMLACIRGRKDIVRLLLIYGSDPFAQDANGLSSLDHARAHRRTAIFQMLFESSMNRSASRLPLRRERRSLVSEVREAEPDETDAWERDMGKICSRMNKEIIGDLYARLVDFKQQNLGEEIALPEPMPRLDPTAQKGRTAAERLMAEERSDAESPWLSSTV
mmetsp:Transcript_35864/g.68792  ORF Transcript_35864/g.68792 Transcript_35864/m.68792 type:complete len:327 (-) Transcript_35864:242-1222(-)